MSLSITTSSLPAATVGVAYNQMLEATLGAGAPYTFYVDSGWPSFSVALPEGLTLNNNTGVISGTPLYYFGDGISDTYNLTFVVYDAENNMAYKSLTMNVNPVINFTTTSPLPNGTVGTAYNKTIQATGGNSSNYNFSITGDYSLPTGLSLNSSTGVISGTPSATGTTGFTITISDGTYTQSKVYMLTINSAPPPISITTSSLPNGTIGTAYNKTLGASGGNGGPYTFSVSSGTLPTGLSLNSSTGNISGTPSATGTSNITFGVSDGTNSTTKSLSITIAYSNTLSISYTSKTSTSIALGYSGTDSTGSSAGTIYRYTGNTNTIATILNGSSSAASGSMTFNGLTAGTTYSFVVDADNSTDYSNVLQVTTLYNNTLAISANPIETTTITINLLGTDTQNVSTGTIYRYTGISADIATIKTGSTLAASSSVQFTGLTANTNYSFVMTSSNGDNSNVISAKTLSNGGGVQGDPHITAIDGKVYDLPNDENCYLLFDNNDVENRIMVISKSWKLSYDAKEASAFYNPYLMENTTYLRYVNIYVKGENCIFDMETLNRVKYTDDVSVNKFLLKETNESVKNMVISDIGDDKFMFKARYHPLKIQKNNIKFNGKYRNIILKTGNKRYIIKISMDKGCSDERNGINISGDNFEGCTGGLISEKDLKVVDSLIPKFN